MSTAEKVRAPRALVVGVIVVLAGCGSYFGWHAWQRHEAAVKTAGKPPPTVPVTVADVRKGDFPIYLNGLGAVQPFDTVLVRSRVDGEVIKVGFRQGQMVKEGDTLVEIDPRMWTAPFLQELFGVGVTGDCGSYVRFSVRSPTTALQDGIRNRGSYAHAAWNAARSIGSSPVFERLDHTTSCCSSRPGLSAPRTRSR